MKFAVRIRYYTLPTYKYVDEQIALFTTLKDAALFASAYNSGNTPSAYIVSLVD